MLSTFKKWFLTAWSIFSSLKKLLLSNKKLRTSSIRNQHGNQLQKFKSVIHLPNLKRRSESWTWKKQQQNSMRTLTWQEIKLSSTKHIWQKNVSGLNLKLIEFLIQCTSAVEVHVAKEKSPYIVNISGRKSLFHLQGRRIPALLSQIS